MIFFDTKFGADVLGCVGEYEIGEQAVKKALEIEPDAPHLKRNLKFYTDIVELHKICDDDLYHMQYEVLYKPE